MLNKIIASVTLGLLLSCSAWAESGQPNWPEILGPSQGSLPKPQEKVVWRTDLAASLQEAKQTGRPLFVTLRCVPCKQCSALDHDVLEGGPELDPLLEQFVTVRLVSARDVDLRVLPMAQYQDMDMSWWGYFLSPEGRIYSVFGGRDEVSDATRISKAALVTTLKRVLDYHCDPRHAAWGIDGPAPDLSQPLMQPDQLAGYKSWAQDRKFDKKASEAGCLHCHQVSEILRQPAIDAKTFDKERDTQIWPLPENVGLTVDRDNGLSVTQVKPDSPAAKAGIQPGDLLAAAGGRKLFGQADFRGILQRGPMGAGAIEVRWVRDGKLMDGQLAVADGWRKTVLSWRRSIAGGNIGAFPGFWTLPIKDDDRKKLGIAPDAMGVRLYAPGTAAKAAGITAGCVLLGIDDQKSNLNGPDLMVWFRMHYNPGDQVTYTIQDGTAAPKQVTLTLTARPN